VCGLKETYDGNRVRMVLGTRKGACGYEPGFYEGGGRRVGADRGGGGVVCCVIQ
jgi:hypothetical protein